MCVNGEHTWSFSAHFLLTVEQVSVVNGLTKYMSATQIAAIAATQMKFNALRTEAQLKKLCLPLLQIASHCINFKSGIIV